MPADRSWVAFTLRPQARFHDGSPITVEDVIWTFETLKTKGRPFYRAYYAQVAKAEKVGARTVRFAFEAGGQPRAAADRRPAARAVPGVLGKRDFDEDHARAAARQRARTGWSRSSPGAPSPTGA